MRRLTKRDVGCWADGAFGHDHLRNVLANLVEPHDAPLADALRGEMSDDASEELDALDIINSKVVDEGLSLELLDGDLVLLRDEEAEP